ncbi:DUF1566 domain-containing protein [Paucibacter sp. TC2R-5]|uniref:DUF1566 domain-containing protein n=1 Tax=Paucibacter sp. TC2R-5 TaxID=2893555 RepID=UPI0021E387E2|nr:DUF1566 domain-containing protein [Paucibacter sp. TC2R-5]MCV2359365.1 DUF1566 domain-containing protein [Paucibacter sp. TC2R-5]
MELLKPTWMSAVAAAAAAIAVWASPAAWAAQPEAPANWAPSEDGAAVIDTATQQIWQRCVAGMQWTGKTCVGEALLMTRAEAGAWALSAAKAEGLSWRLPRVPELKRLAAHSAHSAPAGERAGAQQALFPAAPSGWYWSVTVSINTTPVNQYDYANIARGRTNENADRLSVRQGWAVNLASGEARADTDKQRKLAVRLVRSAP